MNIHEIVTATMFKQWRVSLVINQNYTDFENNTELNNENKNEVVKYEIQINN